jgi:hypothetical protein
MTDLNSHNDDSDDDAPQHRESLEITGTLALVTAALTQLDGAAFTKAITQSSPQIIVIRLPSPQWARAVAQHLRQQRDGPHAQAIIDLRKDGNAGLARDLLEYLTLNMHLVLVSHDPEGLLPANLRAAIDLEFTISTPGVALVRDAIRKVTGGSVRSLRLADFEQLDFDALALALRSGSTAADSLRRLRRASDQLRTLRVPDSGPKLEELPLTGPVNAWASALLADLRRVGAGEMDPGDLLYAMLEGPPGTGKTMIASALARSAGWRIVSTSVPAWFANSDGHLGGLPRLLPPSLPTF